MSEYQILTREFNCIVKEVTKMNTKTITLTGEETAVRFDNNYSYFWVRNFGNNNVYMSDSPGIVPGANGVVTVPAGGGASSGDVSQTGTQASTMYFLGSGEIEVSPQYNAVCPFFKSAGKGGDNNGNNDEILCSMPLINDLQDTSGFGRTVEYTGQTPLTINENGIFLYYGMLILNGEFLDDISNYTVEFDVKINSTGAPKYPYYRRALTVGNISLEISFKSTASTNQFTLMMLNNISYRVIAPTQNKYADSLYHHLTFYHDKISKFVWVSVDGGDIMFMTYTSNDDKPISLGDNLYGLNGYIKNLKIRR